MNADIIAIALIIGIAVSSTLFSLVYGLTVKWWRSILGVALFVSSSSLALLVDIALIYQMFGDDYPGRDIVRNSVYAYIFVGATLKLVALLVDKWKGRRSAQATHPHTDQFTTGD